MSLLNKKINLLKNNIQEILNICKNPNIDDIKIREFQFKKNEYMIELNDALHEFKKIKQEQEYKKISRDTDSITYHRIKNKSNVLDLMTNVKENRDKAKDIFEKTNVLKNTYVKKEKELIDKTGIRLPMFLFFYKDIQDKYSKCFFIELNDDCLLNRQNWLLNQNDKGKLYYDLYDKLVNKKIYNNYININNRLEEYFNNCHVNFLNKIQYNTFQEIQESIKEYKSSSIKTKQLKDKFNVIINILSILTKETGYKINEYLSTYYNLIIPINLIKDHTNSNNDESSLKLIKIYEDNLYEYKLNKDNITISLKYVVNTTNNLTNIFYDYLYTQSIIIKSIKHEGKYFKKWTELLEEEKLDRYCSYATYFVEKFLIEPDLIKNNESNSIIESLKILLNDNHNNKTLKYKNIKWNINRGIIENIQSLKYDDIKKEFYFIIEKLKKENTETIKKPSSIKTIFNKDIEEIMNEELVKFMIICKKQDKLKDKNIKELKLSFLEKIKLKLKLKRLSISDRAQINKKFDEIYNIVYNNDSTT